MNSQSGMKNSEMFARHMDIGTSLVLGNQYGDEGKGKVVDILTQDSDVVIRFQGGHNAGHTVKVNGQEFDLHILPSGVVSKGKINLITSGCVLGIDLNKIELDRLLIDRTGVCFNYELDALLKRKNGEIIRVGLIPEIEKLKAKGIDFKKSGLKISGETIVIGLHNVILDGYDEKCREFAGLSPIGSTGSGISRAYSSESQRLHFTLNDLLKRPDDYYASIKALWTGYSEVFPLINASDLIKYAKIERQKIIELLKNKELEIIDNEKEYIEELNNSGKKIVGEGAQATMIGSANSYFGTASNPSFEEFSRITGLTAKQVGNIFLVHKMPQSSVGYRPKFLKFPTSQAVEDFIDKYSEIGVSTGRRRDLFQFTLPETARATYLNTTGIDDESKIVGVFNRVDGIADTISFYSDGVIKIIIGYSYEILNILDLENGGKVKVNVGVTNGENINPKNLLRNYPSKSDQLSLFGVKQEDILMAGVVKNTKNVQEQIRALLGLHLGAIYKEDFQREVLIGTGPDRINMHIEKLSPMRNI